MSGVGQLMFYVPVSKKKTEQQININSLHFYKKNKTYLRDCTVKYAGIVNKGEN